MRAIAAFLQPLGISKETSFEYAEVLVLLGADEPESLRMLGDYDLSRAGVRLIHRRLIQKHFGILPPTEPPPPTPPPTARPWDPSEPKGAIYEPVWAETVPTGPKDKRYAFICV